MRITRILFLVLVTMTLIIGITEAKVKVQASNDPMRDIIVNYYLNTTIMIGGNATGNYTESDPIFSAWDKNYADLTNKPVPSNFTRIWQADNNVIYFNTSIQPDKTNHYSLGNASRRVASIYVYNLYATVFYSDAVVATGSSLFLDTTNLGFITLGGGNAVNVTIDADLYSTQMKGTGNGYVCVNPSGQMFRSATACT